MGRLRAVARKTWLRRPYVRWCERDLADSDVLIAAYPRSGSTWFRMMLYCAVTGGHASFDMIDRVAPAAVSHADRTLSYLPGGGMFRKTHEPYRPGYGRSIYLVRDGRDVGVSFFHYLSRQDQYAGSQAAFIDRYLGRGVDVYSTWASHVRGWLQGIDARNDVLLVRYEDLLDDPALVLSRVVRFVGMDLDAEHVNLAIEKYSRDAMQSDAARLVQAGKVPQQLGTFVHRASSRQWQGVWSRSQLADFDQQVGDFMARLGYDQCGLLESAGVGSQS